MAAGWVDWWRGLLGWLSPEPAAPEGRRIRLLWKSPSWKPAWRSPSFRPKWQSPSWKPLWRSSSMPAPVAEIRIHLGEQAELEFQPATATDVTAWTLRLDISEVLATGTSGTPVLTLASGGSGITMTSAGVITATISRAQALALGTGTFGWTLTRSDSGKVISEGTLVVLPVGRDSDP